MTDSDRTDGEDERGAASGRDVISSLPRHRPHRRSAKRGETRASAAAAESKAAATPKPKSTPKAVKPRAKAKPAAKTTRTPREKIGATAGAKTRDASARAAQRPPRATPSTDKPQGPPSGTELIGTAVQAAGELASIGLKLGTQAVKNAVGRLPRP